MSDQIMIMLNDNKEARNLKQEFEKFAHESNLSKEEIEEERKLMIMLAMTLVPGTIKLMGKEVYQEINEGKAV